MSDMSKDFAEARARGEAANMRDEVAALRLMLREVAATNATGIDYALRCQRERDEARGERDEAHASWLLWQGKYGDAKRELAELRMGRDAARAEAEEAARAYNDVAADLRRTAAELATTKRELHRLIHGTAIEGDGACEHEIHADAARAWARLWHREARRLWREVQDLNALLSEEHREVMRLRSVIRRYLRTNPPQVEALRDLLVRSANGESIDAGLATTRAGALREAADIARAHGGISAYYAIRQLAAEVEP